MKLNAPKTSVLRLDRDGKVAPFDQNPCQNISQIMRTRADKSVLDACSSEQILQWPD